MLDVADHGTEGRVLCGRALTLDQDLLDRVLREGVLESALGAPRLTNATLSRILSLGAERATDHERDHDEGKPTPDRLLSVLGTPATHRSRQVRGLPLPPFRHLASQSLMIW